jgi:hypothetical protein
MKIKTAVIAVIVGLWLVGLLLGQGKGKNYDDETPNNPNPPITRDYINEDDIELEEGINTP